MRQLRVLLLCLVSNSLACLGHNSCCTEGNPCPEFQGDCDTGHDCAEGLTCGEDNCDPDMLPQYADYPNKWSDGDDCCVTKPACDDLDSCCTYESPCDEGEGDCDFDWECRGDLVCGDDNCGVSLRFHNDDDCCYREPKNG